MGWLLLAAIPVATLAMPLRFSGRSNSSLKASSCSCMNWKEVYASKLSVCGRANEFLPHPRLPETQQQFRKDVSAMGPEFCDRFFTHLDNRKCVNMNMGPDRGQWCYVSQTCAQAEKVPLSAVSWKNCSAQDLLFRDATPIELAAYAHANNLDLGLLHKLSYPLYTEHMWSDVEMFWGFGSSPISSMPAELRQEMQQIVDSGKPYSFDTAADKHPPHRIVVGMTVYAVETVETSPSTSRNELICVRGCPPGIELGAIV